jgi:hypothetical protein
MSYDDLFVCLGILQTNCILFGESSGRALFPLFSLMNHNCLANAKHTMYIQNKYVVSCSTSQISKYRIWWSCIRLTKNNVVPVPIFDSEPK